VMGSNLTGAGRTGPGPFKPARFLGLLRWIAMSSAPQDL
jgi:hypothetical protein